MNKQKLLIIGKGGAKEGMGHLVRISTLLEVLSPIFDITVLVKQDRFGEFFFKQKGIDCVTYHDNRGLYRFLEKNARTEKYRVIIIDIYRISITVIKKIENYCNLLVNFDDMQRRVRHRINGIFLCPQEPFNCQTTTVDCTTIIKGTDYFPIRQVFTQYRERKTFPKDVKEIGIILGGVPARASIIKLTQLLDSFLAKGIQLHVVMGYEPDETDTAMFSPRVHLIKNIDNMAEFIARMDMGIIAGGFIKFEMMCIGTPFLLVSLCDHQQKLARKFSANRYGVYLGDIKHLFASQIKLQKKIESFLTDESMRKEMYKRSRQLVDGQGSGRILSLIADK